MRTGMRWFLPVLTLLFGCQRSGPDWDSINTGLTDDYPDVRHISTDDYIRDFQHEALLIDVRAPQEYAVSHIPGAVNLTDAEAIAEMVTGQNKPVVVYCSVGYRSADMARQLAVYGVDHVVNLQGSIFAWANEGRELVNRDGATKQVHPYDEHWGKLLDKSVPTVNE